MDFFYIWLRRLLLGLSADYDQAFQTALGPKWDHTTQDGELVDDCARHDKNSLTSKKVYEDGMARAFEACSNSLSENGRMVVVFANKKPDAWEALVSAVIRAGFSVTGTWPIATEMRGGIRNIGRASLASSVWLVCKKRLESARPGWDNRVLDEMRQNIHTRLRDYWDAGIRGPDFVWAATGPAMEAYSKHPVVKKANEPGKLMEVSEFLRAVRRLVVDFVVGRVLTGEGGDETTASGLDDITTYYILHRHDFGLGDAPVGACILYAVSCNLSDTELTNRHEILLRTGGLAAAAAEDDGDADDDESDEPDADAEPEEGTGSTVKLRTWNQRKRKTMGYDEEGRPAPLIDQVHRLMLLWKLGDVVKVDDYLDARGLRKNALFLQLLQALIELAGEGTDERVVLENLSNHLAARGVAPARSQTLPGLGGEPEDE
jgi:putative DNA methylase